MFTVLIAEKEHIDAIRQENKLFFEPFLESKELAFCYWNTAGQNLYDSVPGLLDVVGRRKEWRAVILNNAKGKFLESQNPFDIVDFTAISSLSAPDRQPQADVPLDEWKLRWQEYYDAVSKEKEKLYRSALECPLQKLSTWLCFRQNDFVLNEVQEKKDAHEWAMDEIQKDEMKPSAILELFEREQYKFELRMKENLRREFVSESRLNVAYPTEIHCISVRTSQSNFFDPDTYWNTGSDKAYSAFSDRNMYFDKMRFVVFDLLPESHRNYRTDYIRFLASVLVFASNPIPSSAMQARKLYALESETDETPLCTLITSYNKKLVATSEVIENEIEKIRSEIPGKLTDKDAESLFCTPKDIPVTLDETCSPEDMYAELDYGLFFDDPENEFHKWNRNKSTSEKALGYIVKQQSRSVKKSVEQAHLSSDMIDVNVSRLTSLQMDDVENYTDAAENEMVDSIPSDFEDISVHLKKLNREAEDVKKVIRRRMTRKVTLALSAVCLGLFLVCFMPFIFANNGTSATITTAVVLTASMAGILVLTMFVTLFFLRLPVILAVNSYNDAAREILADIHNSMRSISKYLSAFCNVRRGQTVRRYSQKNDDEYTKSIRIRKKHQEDIRKKKACLVENYGDYLGDKTYCDETMSRPYDYDFDQRTEYEYPVPFLAGDSRQIEFISNGNFVSVPSSYITRVLIRMEEIYEK